MREYQKPIAVIAKYEFAEHITAASGVLTCSWDSVYTYEPEMVNDYTHECHQHSQGTGKYEHLAV